GGGLFAYPANRKNKRGKLRLLYEASPLAFIVEQAGGAATDGHERILDIHPTELHQRTPLFIGSANDVAAAGTILAGARAGASEQPQARREALSFGNPRKNRLPTRRRRRGLRVGPR